MVSSYSSSSLFVSLTSLSFFLFFFSSTFSCSEEEDFRCMYTLSQIHPSTCIHTIRIEGSVLFPSPCVATVPLLLLLGKVKRLSLLSFSSKERRKVFFFLEISLLYFLYSFLA
ncbi:hypothetical protein CSUI_004871 [Cystoisospora suis]|uniref:Transmembrane protein n=1 Tax=Cystoisospora suis TaxID=483139 RepID=A0A2C6KZL2_9APIC|nr:hypothetical protein CSUI_004871 [Cystoisospora suis]